MRANLFSLNSVRTWTGSNSDGTGKDGRQARPLPQGSPTGTPTTGPAGTYGTQSETKSTGTIRTGNLSRRLYGLSPVITVSDTPGKVTGVQVDRITHDSIRVRWTKPAESSSRPITSFGIYTRTRNAADTGWDGWTWRHNPGSSATSHTVTGLPSKARQQVRVFARAEQSGETTLYGADSDHVEFTTTVEDVTPRP